MHLQRLSLTHFKNYASSDLTFSPQLNCISGPNGSGKTNLLDAIGFLSLTKSFFPPTDLECISYGEQFFRIEGSFNRGNTEEEVSVTVQAGEKKSVKLNNNEHRRLADHIGLFPLVMIAPNDIMLMHSGSEERRKFLDLMIAQADRLYLSDLLAYNKVLAQRNKQLRLFAEADFFDRILIEAYNEQLVTHGQAVFRKRESFMEAFLPLFRRFYADISSGAEEAGLAYCSQLQEKDLAELLQEHESNDRAAQRSTRGVHKDDLELLLGGRLLARFGSQGQQKSFIIALRLAQYEYLKEARGAKPLLLLDDIFEKLDGERLNKLLSMIAESAFGQIFITDTHPGRLRLVFEGMKDVRVKYFATASGRIAEL